MKVNPHKLPHFFSISAVFVLLAANSGCGKNSTSNVILGHAPKCSKTSSTSTDREYAQITLQLSPSPNSQAFVQQAIGTGFLDIITQDKTGKQLSRRCTMTLRPIGQSSTEVRVWTAGHCAYDPYSVEFLNSKYTLQIFQGRGYFSVPVSFTELEALGKFAFVLGQTILGGTIPLPDSIKAQINSALPNSNTKICEEQDRLFRNRLGSNAKNIACFSRNEMRGLKATLKLSTTTEPFLKEVIKIIREREKPVVDKIDLTTQKIIDAYLISHSSEQRRISDLRSISYLINKNFCDPRITPKPDAENSSQEDSSLGCFFRSKIIDLLKTNLPEKDYTLAKNVFDDDSTDLKILRKQTLGCNNLSIENIDSVTDLEKLTPCDMGNISDTFWKKYVDSGPKIQTNLLSPSIFGLNEETYFGFFTNSTSTSSSAESQALLFSLNPKTILNFEYTQRLESGRTSTENAFLMNYDAKNNQISPVKGASGSVLSVFGIIPAGLLSTVDGEPTSGGTGITPLPQINDDDSLPAKGSSPNC